MCSKLPTRGHSLVYSRQVYWGVSHEFPVVDELVKQHLIPSKAATFRKVEAQGVVPDVIEYAFQDMLTYFDNPTTFLTDLTVTSVLASLKMGTSMTELPKAPLYIYKSVCEELSPVADSDALY